MTVFSSYHALQKQEVWHACIFLFSSLFSGMTKLIHWYIIRVFAHESCMYSSTLYITIWLCVIAILNTFLDHICYFQFHQDTVDVEEEAKKLKSHPYLMVLESAEAISFLFEREAFVETETFNCVLLYCFAAYYVFNINPSAVFQFFFNFFTDIWTGVSFC